MAGVTSGKPIRNSLFCGDQIAFASEILLARSFRRALSIIFENSAEKSFLTAKLPKNISKERKATALAYEKYRRRMSEDSIAE